MPLEPVQALVQDGVPHLIYMLVDDVSESLFDQDDVGTLRFLLLQHTLSPFARRYSHAQHILPDLVCKCVTISAIALKEQHKRQRHLVLQMAMNI